MPIAPATPAPALTLAEHHRQVANCWGSDPFTAYDLATSGLKDFPDDLLLKQKQAHALARTNLGDKDALGKMVACAIKITPDDALSKTITTTHMHFVLNTLFIDFYTRFVSYMNTQRIPPLIIDD